MLSVHFDDKPLSLHMTGHAGAGKKGEDIVCSAASILMYTLAQVCKIFEASRYLAEAPLICLESGDSLVSIKPLRQSRDTRATAFWQTQVGFMLLANTYPGNVRIQSFLCAKEGQPL